MRLRESKHLLSKKLKQRRMQNDIAIIISFNHLNINILTLLVLIIIYI